MLIALGGGALLVAAIVGVASAPGSVDLSLPAPSQLTVSYLLDLVLFLLLAAGLLVLAAIVWALWPRKDDPPVAPRPPPRPWPLRTIMALLPMLLVVTAFAVAAARHKPGQPPLRFLSPPAAHAAGPAAAEGGTAETAAVAAGLTVLALLAILAVLLVLWLRAGRKGAVPGRGPGADELAAAVEISIDALRAEPDPRRAVIAAYAALEGSLTAAGVARSRHEAPFEYVVRALDRLPGHGDDLRRVAELFELAKFSRHAVDPAMKEDALSALVRVRDGLTADEPVPSPS